MKYTVKLFTSNLLYLNVFDVILIRLVGEDGESDQTWLSGVRRLLSGGETTFTLYCPESIGKVLIVEVGKQQLPLVPEGSTFVDKVEVTDPDNCVSTFPIYHWIKKSKVYRFREGRAIRCFDEHHGLSKYSREMELKDRRLEYNWHMNREGFPFCMKADQVSSLPYDAQFSLTKDVQFKFTAVQGLIEINLGGLANCNDSWESFDAISKSFSSHRSDASDYVKKHWREDAFFGYQYLNGNNPILIQRCTSLPNNFPVTDKMVRLEGGAKLTDEMKKGKIFLCDYKLLAKVKTCNINEKQQYLASPLVLLHITPGNELKPIAIQLKQTPSKDNPIFVPSDSEYDWLLAKTFVRSASFIQHELNTHLLRTHLLAEVFTVALLRNVPSVHPLYKLLVPHTRYTLEINLMARQELISDDGFFAKYTAPAKEGMVTILQRSLSSLTYSSLCIPEDIKERGVESVPNYYYRDDGLRLWDIINRFVAGVVNHYYKSNTEVTKDTEMQNYIKDIFIHGFLSNEKTGIPQSISTVDELVKFVTMVIFTSSAQHSAVNNGQFDFDSWMPNAPSTLRRPPPTEKGQASEETLLKTLPDVSTTVHTVVVSRILSTQSTDFVALGQHPEQFFTEAVPCTLMKRCQEELKRLDETIDERNKDLPLPYTYMKPINMENSVSL